MQRHKRVRPDDNDCFGWELQPTLGHVIVVRLTSQVAELSVAASPLPQALILIGQRLTDEPCLRQLVILSWTAPESVPTNPAVAHLAITVVVELAGGLMVAQCLRLHATS